MLFRSNTYGGTFRLFDKVLTRYGLQFSYVDTSKLDATADKKSLVNQAIEVLRKRVDKFGVAEPIIVAEGDERIVIQMPGLNQAERDAVRDALTKPAFLEFRMVHPDSDRMMRDGLMAPGHQVLAQRRKGADGRDYLERVLVKTKAEGGLTGKYIKSAGVIRDQVSNRPQISFEFNSEGAKIFGDLTTKFTRERMAIVLDGVDMVQLPEDEMRNYRGNKIAMILQDPHASLNPVFTVGNQLTEVVTTHAKEKLQKSVVFDRAVDALRMVQVAAPERRMHDYPHQMSGGMKQRVVGAMAIASRPRVLIARSERAHV